MRKELRIKNQMAELEKVNQFIEEISEELGLSMELTMNLNLVMEEMVVNVISYAYSEGCLRLNMRDPFNRLWIHYFMQTPWFDEPAMARLYAGFEQLHIGFKSAMADVSAIVSGKTRAFFTLSENVDAVKNYFSVRDDEQIIRAESKNSLKKLLDAMKKSRGKKVFFIVLPDFPYQVLIDAGFKPGVDFVNGMEFLSEAQGVPLNSYELIKAM